MNRPRPLAAHLGLTHAMVALFGCSLLAVLVALLVPRLYLQQRQQALLGQARDLAAEAGPWLAGEGERPALAIAGLRGAAVWLYDRQGKPVAFTRGLGMGMPGRPLGAGPGPGARRHGLLALMHIAPEHWQQIARGRVLAGTVGLRGGERVYQVVVPAYAGREFAGAVALHARLADLSGTGMALVPVVLAASALAALAAVLAGAWLARRVARPLQRMTRAAERVAGGDLQVTVEPPAWQEGEALALAFNRMTTSLAAQEQARRQFIADASHQLRAPLTSLQAQAEAMLDGVVSDEATRRRFLARMVGQTRALAALAQELLDLERLDAQTAPGQPQQVDMRTLLADAAAAFPGEGDNHLIQLQLPETLPAVWADPGEVRQAVVNLVDNALKHTPAGKPVRIWASAEGKHVAVGVTDEGPGIAPEHLARVWDRFYRIPGDDSPGHGLGLAIVKRLVERQGGTVQVHSDPGRGSTFSFLLPMSSQPSRRDDADLSLR